MLVGEPDIVHHRYSVGREDHLHCYLVHAVSRREGIASGVRYADGLEHTLEDAVFDIGAVKHWYYHIEGRYRLALVENALALGRVEIVVAVYRAHIHLGAVGEKVLYALLVIGDIAQRIAGVPVAVFGYIDWHDIIFVPVYRCHSLIG